MSYVVISLVCRHAVLGLWIDKFLSNLSSYCLVNISMILFNIEEKILFAEFYCSNASNSPVFTIFSARPLD